MYAKGLKAVLYANPEDYDKSLAELALAEKAEPRDADIYCLREKIYLSGQQYGDTVEQLRPAVELQTTTPAFYYQLGLAYRRLGKPDLGNALFERVEYLKRLPAAPPEVARAAQRISPGAKQYKGEVIVVKER